MFRSSLSFTGSAPGRAPSPFCFVVNVGSVFLSFISLALSKACLLPRCRVLCTSCSLLLPHAQGC